MRKMQLGKARDMLEGPLKPRTVQEFGFICLSAGGGLTHHSPVAEAEAGLQDLRT